MQKSLSASTVMYKNMQAPSDANYYETPVDVVTSGAAASSQDHYSHLKY